MEKPASQDISIKLYRSIKCKLKHYESDNYDKIYLIPCNGSENWHELAEHSALIYYYEVAKPLNLRTKFFADTLSFYDQYEIGYIRTRGVDTVRRNLKRAKLYKDEQPEKDFHVFLLNKSFTPEYLKEIKQQEFNRRLSNLTLVETNNLNPELHQLLVTMSTRFHRICNSRLDRMSASTIGVRIVNLSDNLLSDYHRLTMVKKNSTQKSLEILTEMRKDIYHLIIEIKVIGEIKLWSYEIISSLSENLFLIRDKIEHQIKLTAKESPIVKNAKKKKES